MPLIFIKMTATNCAVKCVNIETSEAFPDNWYDLPYYNGDLNQAAIVRMKNTSNCWVENIEVFRGYGATIWLAGSNNCSVLGSFLDDNWTHGGNSGGKQGYSVYVGNSDNNLIENNHLRRGTTQCNCGRLL